MGGVSFPQIDLEIPYLSDWIYSNNHSTLSGFRFDRMQYQALVGGSSSSTQGLNPFSSTTGASTNNEKEKSLSDTLFEIGLSVAIGLISSSSASRMMKAVIAEGATAAQMTSGVISLARTTAGITAGVPFVNASLYAGAAVALQGGSLGAIVGFVKSWFGDENDWGKSIVDYGLMGVSASLGAFMRPALQLFKEGKVVVEVAEKASSVWINSLDGLLSGGVSSVTESVRAQLRDEDKAWYEIDGLKALKEGVSGMGYGALFGGVLPLGFKKVGSWAGSLFEKVPQVPSSFKVRRDARGVLNALHELVHKEGGELASVKTQAKALLDGASHLTEEALEEAGLTKRVLTDVRAVVDGDADLSTVRRMVRGNRLQAAKDELASDVSDWRWERELPGGKRSCKAPGVREIPEALREDDYFKSLHPNGRFTAPLSFEQRWKVAEYVTGVPLGAMDNPFQTLKALDDTQLTKLLRYFGVYQKSPSDWAIECQMARRCLDGKWDVDDTLLEQLRAFGLELIPGLPAVPFKVVAAFFKGDVGLNFLAQAHSVTPLLLRAFVKGPLYAETDTIPGIARFMGELFPTIRRVLFGLEPYQNPTLMDVFRSVTLKTSAKQKQALDFLRRIVEEGGFDNLSEGFKRAVAIIASNKKGWKMKIPDLFDLLPGFEGVSQKIKRGELVSFDNASYYTEFIRRCGGKAVKVIDRVMSLLGGNWVNVDPWGSVNLWSRVTRLRDYRVFQGPLNGLGRATSKGGINRLPATQYGWDYILSGAEEVAKLEGPALVSFGGAVKSIWKKIGRALYLRPPHNPLDTTYVARGTGNYPLPYLAKHFFWNIQRGTKSIVKGMTKTMEERVDGNKVSDLAKAKAFYDEMMREPLGSLFNVRIYPDYPTPRTDSMDDIVKLLDE